MTIDQLTYFLTAARTGSISAAAKIAHVTPSAISHAISALEEELGRDLFVRQGRQIIPTNHGKLLMERLGPLLADVTRLREEMMADEVELHGHFTMASSHFLLDEWLAPAWLRLKNRHPRLSCVLKPLRSSEVVSMAERGELDVGFCLSPQSNPHIDFEDIHVEPLVLAMRAGHPLFRLAPEEQIAGLASYPATLPAGTTGIEDCERHPSIVALNVSPRIDVFFESYGTALTLITRSDMWTLLPSSLVSRRLGHIEALVPPHWAATVRYTAIWPKSRILTRPLRELFGILRSVITQTAKGDA